MIRLKLLFEIDPSDHLRIVERVNNYLKNDMIRLNLLFENNYKSFFILMFKIMIVHSSAELVWLLSF